VLLCVSCEGWVEIFSLSGKKSGGSSSGMSTIEFCVLKSSACCSVISSGAGSPGGAAVLAESVVPLRSCIGCAVAINAR